MLEKIVGAMCGFALIGGIIYLVKLTEKPWPLIEGEPLDRQVAACQFTNLRTGAENYLEVLRVLGMRVDLGTGIDLAVNGPPSLGRRYACFGNLSDTERARVIASPEYAAIQLEIHRQIQALGAPERGR